MHGGLSRILYSIYLETLGIRSTVHCSSTATGRCTYKLQRTVRFDHACVYFTYIPRAYNLCANESAQSLIRVSAAAARLPQATWAYDYGASARVSSSSMMDPLPFRRPCPPMSIVGPRPRVSQRRFQGDARGPLGGPLGRSVTQGTTGGERCGRPAVPHSHVFARCVPLCKLRDGHVHLLAISHALDTHLRTCTSAWHGTVRSPRSPTSMRSTCREQRVVTAGVGGERRQVGM